MFWRAIAGLLMGLVAGGVCLAGIPAWHQRQAEHFARTEAFFKYPIPLFSSSVKLRKDSYGKGYFGASRDGGRTHEGVDLSVETKMPIYAAKSGRVVFAGTGKGYGKYIELSHPDGRSTRYAHLSELCCQLGDWVDRGSVIGVSGKTGNASSRHIRPHLHFEIRQQGKPINPAAWMDPGIQLR